MPSEVLHKNDLIALLKIYFWRGSQILHCPSWFQYICVLNFIHKNILQHTYLLSLHMNWIHKAYVYPSIKWCKYCFWIWTQLPSIFLSCLNCDLCTYVHFSSLFRRREFANHTLYFIFHFFHHRIINCLLTVNSEKCKTLICCT